MITCKSALAILFVWCVISGTVAHDAKDFDDSILYKIDFEIPDFDTNPELKHQLRTFHTHVKEKYDCVIPVLEDSKKEQQANNPGLSPYTLLRPLFTSSSCSYRIEAYWSYEVCHGKHVRQYHEEREGKNVKFQEYLLGKWSQAQRDHVNMYMWDDKYKPDMKHKTTKIDNTKYPYFEVEMTDGTMCDIINAPRTTIVRYVCYPHGKNEIYSFKETSSCNYEAIILTSALCMIPSFHPEESKEVSIKCFNSLSDPNKPLSMLRQELEEMQLMNDDVTGAKAALIISSQINRWIFFDKFGENIDNPTIDNELESGTTPSDTFSMETPAVELSPIRNFISGKNCLTGGTGWWKYEFCYGRHVRQFHKDKKSEIDLFLGYFDENAHRQWAKSNPEKLTKRVGYSASLWHHYEKGTRCDRTGLPREVDVKLTCTPIKNSATAVSMYLLEPKTCQYILVVESPIICGLMQVVDEYGLVEQVQLNSMREYVRSTPELSPSSTTGTKNDINETPATAENSQGLLGPTGDRTSTTSNDGDTNEDVPT